MHKTEYWQTRKIDKIMQTNQLKISHNYKNYVPKLNDQSEIMVNWLLWKFIYK